MPNEILSKPFHILHHHASFWPSSSNIYNATLHAKRTRLVSASNNTVLTHLYPLRLQLTLLILLIVPIVQQNHWTKRNDGTILANLSGYISFRIPKAVRENLFAKNHFSLKKTSTRKQHNNFYPSTSCPLFSCLTFACSCKSLPCSVQQHGVPPHWVHAPFIPKASNFSACICVFESLRLENVFDTDAKVVVCFNFIFATSSFIFVLSIHPFILCLRVVLLLVFCCIALIQHT